MAEAGAGLGEAVAGLAAFLGAEPFTAKIAQLEHDLVGARARDISGITSASGIDRTLLHQALTARQHLGRINDLIHAAAISLALPDLLEEGERLLRPSLAAGNDPSRPFDIETDRRVAEFKLARWQGPDAMRKRQVFKDLVNLAADATGRRAELYVLGPRPVRFLRTSSSPASWALDRARRERELFETRFGSLSMSVGSFTQTAATHVSLIDLEQRLPDIFRDLDI